MNLTFKQASKVAVRSTVAFALLAIAPQVLADATLPSPLTQATFGAFALNSLAGSSYGAPQIKVKPPLGTKQAWTVDVTGTLDAGKLAREQGGNVNIIQILPPSISRGNSQNQEILTTLTLDGQNAKIMKTEDGKTEVLVITATPNSGTAYLKLTGIVYNRHMADISDGGTKISAEDKARFTDGYFTFDMKTAEVKQRLQELGLVRRENELDSELVKRVCLWLANNKTATTSGAGAGPETAQLLDQVALNCNGASKTLLAILKTNGIAAKANPRLHLLNDGKTSQHSDIIVYISDQNKWMGVSGAGLISSDKDLAINRGVSGKIGSFGHDISLTGTFIDMADDVGHMILIPGISRYYSYFNEVNPTWSKAGSGGKVRGKVYYQFTHKFTPLDIEAQVKN